VSAELVTHFFLNPGAELPPADESKLVEYVHGSNGVLARSRREGIEAALPAGFSFTDLPGLAPVAPYVRWELPRVPAALVEVMLNVSRAACTPNPAEALFYLHYGPAPEDRGQLVTRDGWNLEMPAQRATADSVEPVETGAGTATARALIEVHSHHSMRADFSEGDDKDEVGWFRVYAILGNIFERPEIRARVSVFGGHVCEWPAREFFELPDELYDAIVIDQAASNQSAISKGR
jgi:hypothetical protein